VIKADLHPSGAHSLKWDMLHADDFVLPPLPNHLFQRDNSRWIYRGVSINPMAKPARQRETLHSRAIYRYHPMSARADFTRYYGDDDAIHLPATIEGGDVHVLGRGAVMVGMGERSTPMAVELLASSLFKSGQASTVIAVELPSSRAMMHLDTVMTMIDRGTFVQYPYLEREPRSWTLTADGTGQTVSVTRYPDLWGKVADRLHGRGVPLPDRPGRDNAHGEARRPAEQPAGRAQHRAHLREGLHPDPFGLRGRRAALGPGTLGACLPKDPPCKGP
jgi:arginine deiminase